MYLTWPGLYQDQSNDVLHLSTLHHLNLIHNWNHKKISDYFCKKFQGLTTTAVKVMNFSNFSFPRTAMVFMSPQKEFNLRFWRKGSLKECTQSGSVWRWIRVCVFEICDQLNISVAQINVQEWWFCQKWDYSPWPMASAAELAAQYPTSLAVQCWFVTDFSFSGVNQCALGMSPSISSRVGIFTLLNISFALLSLRKMKDYS